MILLTCPLQATKSEHQRNPLLFSGPVESRVSLPVLPPIVTRVPWRGMSSKTQPPRGKAAAGHRSWGWVTP